MANLARYKSLIVLFAVMVLMALVFGLYDFLSSKNDFNFGSAEEVGEFDDIQPTQIDQIDNISEFY